MNIPRRRPPRTGGLFSALACVVLVAVLVGPVLAANCTVTLPAGGDFANRLSAALSAASNSSSRVVCLDPGTFTDCGGPVAYNGGGGDASLELRGAGETGTTIDCTNEPLLAVDGLANFTVRDLSVLSAGEDEGTVAFTVDGSDTAVVFDSVSLMNSTCGTDGTVVVVSGPRMSVSLTDVTFSNTSEGAANCLDIETSDDAAVTLTRVSIQEGSNDVNGVGVRVSRHSSSSGPELAAVVTVVDSVFGVNVGTSDGLFDVSDSSLTFVDTEFSDNEAPLGALIRHSADPGAGAVFNLTRVNLYRNVRCSSHLTSAGADTAVLSSLRAVGGTSSSGSVLAISSATVVEVVDTEVVDAATGSLGSIGGVGAGSSLTFTKLAVANNTINGAVSASSFASVTLDTVELFGNTVGGGTGVLSVSFSGGGSYAVAFAADGVVAEANSMTGVVGFGSALYVSGSTSLPATVSVVNSEFTDNSGYVGAGLRVALTGTTTVNFDSLTATGNTAIQYGGGLVVSGCTSLSLTSLTVTDNSAALYGGALVATSSGAVTVADLIATDNAVTSIATSYGSAVVFSSAASLSLTDTRIASNTGGGAAAVIRSTTTAVTLTNVKFSDNAGVLAGAGVEVSGGVTTAVNVSACTFTNNRQVSGALTTTGAGLYAADVALSVESSMFSGNTAETGGALAVNSVISAALYNLTFDSNSATGSGAGLSTSYPLLFTLSKSSFTDNTAAVSGGGIYAVGDGSQLMTISEIDFSNNKAANGNGGALRSSYMAVSASSVTVEDSVASGFGGGFYVVGSPVSLSLTEFTRCTAARGAGVYGSASVAVWTSVQFTYGTASERAGAFYLAATEVSADSLTIVNNTATLSGGAVYVAQNSFGSVADSVIRWNTAGTNGGGLYVTSVTSGTASVFNCSSLELDHNTATSGSGGAAYIGSFVTVNLEDSDVSDNSAGSSGGGIAADLKFGVLATAAVSFHDNVATSGGALYAANEASLNLGPGTVLMYNTGTSEGGAIFVDSSGSLDATGVSVADNTASVAGGAIVCSGATCSLTGSTVERNGAVSGGAILAENGPLSLTGCTVADNSATNTGGAVQCASSAVCTATDCNVLRNTGTSGAAFFCSFCTLAVTGGDLRANVASVSGAAMSCYTGGICSIGGATVSNNTGGMVLQALLLAEMSVSRTDVDSNTGGVEGFGASNVTIYDSAFHRNSGPAVSVQASPLIVRNTVIRDNTAVAVVAVIDSATETEFTNVFIAANEGVGLSCTAATLAVSGSVLCENTASNVECDEGCYVGGLPGGCYPNNTECEAACTSADFCVPITKTIFAGPYDGCLACDGFCDTGNYSCATNADCYDTASGYGCTCVTGYEGDGKNSCDDFDECALGLDNCDVNADCINTNGSFTCECRTGWGGNGVECYDIDECGGSSYSGGGHDCSALAVCTNVAGSFTCECLADTYGDGTTCTACPANTKTVGPGAASVTQCTCKNGYFNVYSTPGLPCTRCPPGYYLLVGPVTECVQCPVDTFTNESSSLFCYDCPAYTETHSFPNTQEANCSCVPGFVPHKGNAPIGCENFCAAGTFRPTLTSPCVECTSGYYTNTSNLDDCIQCPKNTETRGLPPYTHVTNCSCSPGFFTPLGVDGVPCEKWCPPGSARLSPDALECQGCGASTYTDTPNSPECLNCPKNSRSPSNSTSIKACVCPERYYTPDKEVGTPCEKCPEGGICGGGTDWPVAAPGYAPIDDEDDKAAFAQCFPQTACEGNGNCAKGYVGELCDECDLGYYRLDGYCRKCDTNPVAIFAVGCAGLFAFCSILVWFNTQERTVNKFASLVIGVNSLQIAAMYGRLDVEWPPLAQKFFDALTIANFNIELMSPECAISVSNPFVLRWLMTVCMPIALGSMFFVVFLVSLLYFEILRVLNVSERWPDSEYFNRYVLERFNAAYMQNTCVRAFYQIMTIVYLPLSATVFELFECRRNANGVYVIQAARDMECYTDTYFGLLGVGIIGFFLYPVGLPAFSAWLIKTKKAELGEIKFNIRYGFLVGRYDPKYSFFEIAVMGRKLGVVLCMAFLTRNPYIKAGGAIAVLIGCYTIHIDLQPYRSPLYNRMETACLACSIVVLLTSITVQNVEGAEDARNGAIIAVIIINLIVIVIGVSIDFYRMTMEEKEMEDHFANAPDNDGFVFDDDDGAVPMGDLHQDDEEDDMSAFGSTQAFGNLAKANMTAGSNDKKLVSVSSVNAAQAQTITYDEVYAEDTNGMESVAGFSDADSPVAMMSYIGGESPVVQGNMFPSGTESDMYNNSGGVGSSGMSSDAFATVTDLQSQKLTVHSGLPGSFVEPFQGAGSANPTFELESSEAGSPMTSEPPPIDPSLSMPMPPPPAANSLDLPPPPPAN